MHKLKIILLTIIGIIAVVITILTYILNSFDNQDYQQLLTKAVDNFSEYTLSIKGSFALHPSLIPSLAASAIELRSKEDDSYITIENFRIQLTLAALLNNTLLINDLLVENMRGEIFPRELVETAIESSDDFPVPIIEHAVLKNIQLNFDNGQQTYRLDSMTITENASQDQIQLLATGQSGASKFKLNGTISLLDDGNNVIGITQENMTNLISGKQIKARYTGNNTLGKTRIKSNLVLSFSNDKPDISGDISITNLLLEDLGIFSDAGNSNSTTQAQSTKPANEPLFSQDAMSLQALHELDLNLKLTVDKLELKNHQFTKIKANLLLNNGDLTIAPLSFNFSGEHVLLSGKLHTSSKPEWAFDINSHNIQVAKILGQQNTASPREGKLGLNATLNASGVSLHEIVSSLKGEVSFVLENEKISKSELEVVFLNPMGWIFSQGLTANEIQISCGIARYTIKQGVIKSKVLLIDGPKLMVRGKEEINLGKETINSVYNLQKKKVIDMALLPDSFNTNVPIIVHGNLLDPVVEQVPYESIGSTAGRYIFAPIAVIPQEVLGAVVELFDGKKAEQQSPCAEYLQN